MNGVFFLASGMMTVIALLNRAKSRIQKRNPIAWSVFPLVFLSHAHLMREERETVLRGF